MLIIVRFTAVNKKQRDVHTHLGIYTFFKKSKLIIYTSIPSQAHLQTTGHQRWLNYQYIQIWEDSRTCSVLQALSLQSSLHINMQSVSKQTKPSRFYDLPNINNLEEGVKYS